MTSPASELKYSLDDVRNALENAKNGTTEDYAEPLNALAIEALRGDHVYIIGPDDLNTFLDDHPDLDDDQREQFRASARKLIGNNDVFGDTLAICLDMALEEVRSA